MSLSTMRPEGLIRTFGRASSVTVVLKEKFGLTDWWCRFEWQGRGSSHSHGLYWFGATPEVDLGCPLSRERFARTWGYYLSAMNPNREQGADQGDPLSVVASDTPVTWEWLNRVVNRCQRHKCNSNYCMRVSKKKKKEWDALVKSAREAAAAAGEPEPARPPEPQPECRFFFPKAERAGPDLVKLPERKAWTFEPKRNDTLMNPFNPLVSLCWLANTDFSPCCDPLAVSNYAAKYCSKAETQSATYAELARRILPHVSDRNPMLSFVSKILNKLIGERDYSAQEVCHVLLGLPLQEDSRVVVMVDCRPPDQQRRRLEFSAGDVEEKQSSYEAYLNRAAQYEDVPYVDMVMDWNTLKKEEWKLFPPEERRIPLYFPRYKAKRSDPKYPDYCRMKLTLNRPHRTEAQLLEIDGRVFENAVAAFEYYCNTPEYHIRRVDGYGEPDDEEAEPEPDQFLAGNVAEEELNLEDWQELARMVPEMGPTEELANLLGRRDIDVSYDWRGHVGQFSHPDFASGSYWAELRSKDPGTYNVEYMPPEAADTLNPEQRLVYDTVMAHYADVRRPKAPLRLQVDGGGGTGKSYMVKVLSAHLQVAAGARRSPIVRAAPTGVASNQIGGQTLHSLFRLPVSGEFRQLSENPGTLSTLQREFRGVHYLVIDEKSMVSLKMLSWIDRRLREIFPDHQNEYFGGLSVILIGDFFQLPPVSATALYTPRPKGGADNLRGANAYAAFDRSVFLRTIQRQQGEDQAPFRTALEELRRSNCSAPSWELLSTRCAVKLTPEEISSFDSALRVYPTRKEVDGYNYDHMLRLESPILSADATHEGRGAAATNSDAAGRLSEKLSLCVGCRVMLTRNLWSNVGLVNGAQGTISHISWSADTPADTDPKDTPPEVVMVVFDNYTGPPFVHDGEDLRCSGKLAVPILRVRQEFMIGDVSCSRTQFPLVPCYAITIHKSQGITLDKVVCDLTAKEFASGLYYVAVSRVKSLQGLMFDVPFDRSKVYHNPPCDGMRLKIADYEARSARGLALPGAGLVGHQIVNTRN